MVNISSSVLKNYKPEVQSLRSSLLELELNLGSFLEPMAMKIHLTWFLLDTVNIYFVLTVGPR
jgi:hypothetical protein